MAAVDRSCVFSRNPLPQISKICCWNRWEGQLWRLQELCNHVPGAPGPGDQKHWSLCQMADVDQEALKSSKSINFLAVTNILGLQNFEEKELERHFSLSVLNHVPYIAGTTRLISFTKGQPKKKKNAFWGSFQDPILQNGCWSVGSWEKKTGVLHAGNPDTVENWMKILRLGHWWLQCWLFQYLRFTEVSLI